MAGFFAPEPLGGAVRVLDAGAGKGSLLDAFAARALTCGVKSLDVTGAEIDPVLLPTLKGRLSGWGFFASSTVHEGDFVESAVRMLGTDTPRFTHAILNPPYKKIAADSEARWRLRSVGIEATNLYAAFAALAIRLLADGGEIVAITPRSFCSGPHFRLFRELVLGETSLRRIHLFESRREAFSADGVLQENVIWHVVKGRPQGKVIVSSSRTVDVDDVAWREVPIECVVRPYDPQKVWHLVRDADGDQLAEDIGRLPASLSDLGLGVMTGKVVEFRARPWLRQVPGDCTGPLIFPAHLGAGSVAWPKDGKKPNALADVDATKSLWMPRGTYVLTKRFTGKEEPKRLVASVLDPSKVPGPRYAFENHLNVFHADGGGLDPPLARGLTAFLNATAVDDYVRQFSGHTQINAMDLRNLRYPSREQLTRIGCAAGDLSCQGRTNAAVFLELDFGM